jgi:hypothetical protein
MKDHGGCPSVGRESTGTAHPITTAQLKKPRLHKARSVRIDARPRAPVLPTNVAPLVRKIFSRRCARVRDIHDINVIPEKQGQVESRSRLCALATKNFLRMSGKFLARRVANDGWRAVNNFSQPSAFWTSANAGIDQKRANQCQVIRFRSKGTAVIATWAVHPSRLARIARRRRA